MIDYLVMRRRTIRNILFAILPLIFFFVHLSILSDYNVNWDEPYHFMRGQAYLRILLTGKTNYKDLPEFDAFHVWMADRMKPTENLPRYSIYQTNSADGEYFLATDYGHPPTSDILAALFNYVLYQQTGLVGDIESYHVFTLVAATIAVAVVFVFASQLYGLFAGIIAFLAITLSPYFITEFHTNIKDPVVAAFFAATIYALYRGIVTIRWQWVVISSVCFGLALGTKPNVVFLPIILGLWFVVTGKNIVQRVRRESQHVRRRFILSLVFYLVIPVLMVYTTWPVLWHDPVGNLLKTVGYYKEIGTGSVYNGRYIFAGLNWYAPLWVAVTTPVAILVLAAFGMVAALRDRSRSHGSLLVCLWLIVPIARVMPPAASIYGGIRQILEYLPALTILAGAGAAALVQLSHRFTQRVRIIELVMLLSFIPIAWNIIRFHPDENLYFNEFIGGLRGAVKHNLPGWGTTLGNSYIHGIKWVNEHAEPGARVAISVGLMPNIPPTQFRPDIQYSNAFKSVTLRKGEYIIGQTYYEFDLPYDAQYPERFLIPVYEKVVDGVPILKVWKNDPDKTKSGYFNEGEEIGGIQTTKKSNHWEIELDRAGFVTRIELEFDPLRCTGTETGYIETSLDGQTWERETESLRDNQIPHIQKDLSRGQLVQLLAAVPARFLRVNLDASSCFLDRGKIRVFTLRDIFP